MRRLLMIINAYNINILITRNYISILLYNIKSLNFVNFTFSIFQSIFVIFHPLFISNNSFKFFIEIFAYIYNIKPSLLMLFFEFFNIMLKIFNSFLINETYILKIYKHYCTFFCYWWDLFFMCFKIHKWKWAYYFI